VATGPVPKGRPVSSHSTASTGSSTPKKVVLVGTLGRTPIDEKKSDVDHTPGGAASSASTHPKHPTD
jgi:hypothetical protein